VEPILEAGHVSLLPPSIRELSFSPKNFWGDQHVSELIAKFPGAKIQIFESLNVTTPPKLPIDESDKTVGQADATFDFDLEQHIAGLTPSRARPRVSIASWNVIFGDQEADMELKPQILQRMRSFRIPQSLVPGSSKFQTTPVSTRVTDFFTSFNRPPPTTDLIVEPRNVQQMLQNPYSAQHLESVDLTLREIGNINVEALCLALPNLKHLRLFGILPVEVFPLAVLPRTLQTLRVPLPAHSIAQLELSDLPPGLTDLMMLVQQGGFSRESVPLWPTSLKRLEITTSKWIESDLIKLRTNLTDATEVIIWGAVGLSGELLSQQSSHLSEPILELTERSIPDVMNRLLSPIKVMTFGIGGQDSSLAPSVAENGKPTNSADDSDVGVADVNGSFGMRLPDSLTSYSLCQPRSLRRRVRNGRKKRIGANDIVGPYSNRSSAVDMSLISDISFLPTTWPSELKSLTLRVSIADMLYHPFPASLTKLHLSHLGQEQSYMPFKSLPPQLLHLSLDSLDEDLNPIVCPSGHLSLLPVHIQTFQCPIIAIPLSDLAVLPKSITKLSFYGGEGWSENAIYGLLKTLPDLQSLSLSYGCLVGEFLEADMTEITHESLKRETLQALQLHARPNAMIKVESWLHAMPLHLPKSLTKLHLTPFPGPQNTKFNPGYGLPSLASLALLPPLPQLLTELSFQLLGTLYISQLGPILPPVLQRLFIISDCVAFTDSYAWLSYPRTLKFIKLLCFLGDASRHPKSEVQVVGLPPQLEELSIPSASIPTEATELLESVPVVHFSNFNKDSIGA
jgi:hypothetical protein